MLFITNRALQEGQTPMVNNVPQVPRAVNFDLTNNQAEQSVYLCSRNSPKNYTEIGGQAFLSQLRDLKKKEILLFVHGYSNLPEEAIFPRVEKLQKLCDQKSPGHTLVIPVIWPCQKNIGESPDNDNEGLLEDYFNDQIAADHSGIAFARLFQKFLAWREKNNNSTVVNPCFTRINILTHSMGARVVRATFANTVQYFLPQGMPLVFRNIFLAAADVVNEALEPNQEGQHISPAARNVVVYYAADDLAMRASKVANIGEIASRRLGHTGPENMDKVSRNVYALDCDEFNNELDSPVGHGYFADNRAGNAGPVFDHMWRCIENGRVPMFPKEAKTAILPLPPSDQNF
jgi:esterase/lipase superfamily enzyme